MLSKIKMFVFLFALFSILNTFMHCEAWGRRKVSYKFVVKEASYERLCKNKKILTVNGKFPGPTIYAHKGDEIIVDVINKGKYNITIHWHGVKQPRYPWSDGPEYITQCPIMPGKKFSQKIILSEEEGTLWWHAHSDWSRATVHGPIVIFPKFGTTYPFPIPFAQVPLILGEWWKADVMEVFRELKASGGDPNVSDAYTINGQPGDFYTCSNSDTFKLDVIWGKTYLIRLINAAMNNMLFFSVAAHQLTVVGTDASYTKPLNVNYVVISPGQTLDLLLHANQKPNRYYMAARAYASSPVVAFDNTTTTGIVNYIGFYNSTLTPRKPRFPNYNDTNAAFEFFKRLRSLMATSFHPMKPPKPKLQIISTVSLNTIPCKNNSCAGPNGTRLAASITNISFVNNDISILEAYYKHISGVYSTKFHDIPSQFYNFTGDDLPQKLLRPQRGTVVKVLKYNSTVEMVFQGTNLLRGIDHPMHLHGYSFYIVGYGFGNFDKNKDPLHYNLVDPPIRNTVLVPRNGWAAIRFQANNPGVWYLHCHLERHLTWGMDTVFIVKNGPMKANTVLPPPPDMPPC